MDIKSLPQIVRERLKSGINIPSVSQCINELIHNSLDANSTAIAVRVNLLNFQIQVVDNGDGVSKSNMLLVGLRYMTSKCQSLKDLDSKLKQYGFRGEALASICNLSRKLIIISRAKELTATYSKTFENGKAGSVMSVKERPNNGTTVSIEDFMYNQPVRRNRINENLDLEEIKRCIESMAIIHPNVSFSLRNDVNGRIISQCKKSENVCKAVKSLHPNINLNDLIPVKISKNNITIKGLIYKKSATTTHLQLLFVNKRRVISSKIQKLINTLLVNSRIFKKSDKILKLEVHENFVTSASKSQHPAYIINIRCPYSEIDLLLQPSKTSVEFKHWDIVQKCFEKIVTHFLKKEKLVDTPVPNRAGDVAISSARSDFSVTQILGAVKSVRVKRKTAETEAHLAEKQSKLAGREGTTHLKAGRYKKLQVRKTVKSSKTSEHEEKLLNKKNSIYTKNRKTFINSVKYNEFVGNSSKNIEQEQENCFLASFPHSTNAIFSKRIKNRGNFNGSDVHDEFVVLRANNDKQIQANDFRAPFLISANAEVRKSQKNLSAVKSTNNNQNQEYDLLKSRKNVRNSRAVISSTKYAPYRKLTDYKLTSARMMMEQEPSEKKNVNYEEKVWKSCSMLDKNEKAGKDLIMDFFLKSTQINFDDDTPTSLRAQSNMCVEKSIVAARDKNTTMTLSVKFKTKKIVENSRYVTKPSVHSRYGHFPIENDQKSRKMVSKALQTTMIEKEITFNLNNVKPRKLFSKCLQTTFIENNAFRLDLRHFNRGFKYVNDNNFNFAPSSCFVKARKCVFRNGFDTRRGNNVPVHCIRNYGVENADTRGRILNRQTVMHPFIGRALYANKCGNYEDLTRLRQTWPNKRLTRQNCVLCRCNADYCRHCVSNHNKNNKKVVTFDKKIKNIFLSYDSHKKSHEFTKNIDTVQHRYLNQPSGYSLKKKMFDFELGKQKMRPPCVPIKNNSINLRNNYYETNWRNEVILEDMYRHKNAYPCVYRQPFQNYAFSCVAPPLMQSAARSLIIPYPKGSNMFHFSPYMEKQKAIPADMQSRRDYITNFKKNQFSLSRSQEYENEKENSIHINKFRDNNRKPSTNILGLIRTPACRELTQTLTTTSCIEKYQDSFDSNENLSNTSPCTENFEPLSFSTEYGVQNYKHLGHYHRNNISNSFSRETGRKDSDNIGEDANVVQKAEHFKTKTNISNNEKFSTTNRTHKIPKSNSNISETSKNMPITLNDGATSGNLLQETVFAARSKNCRQIMSPTNRSENKLIITFNRNDKRKIFEKDLIAERNLNKNANSQSTSSHSNKLHENMANIENFSHEIAAGKDGWLKKFRNFGSAFYVNPRNGMTSLFTPKSERQFNFTKRPEFVPKGLSPILIKTKEVDVLLSPNAKKSLHTAIIQSYENDLQCVKWQNYVQNGDVNGFFEELYKAKNKIFEKHQSLSGIKSKLSNRIPHAIKFSKDIFNSLRIIGQLDKKFIVSFDHKQKMILLFDQHAVHERIRLESLLEGYKNREVSSAIKFEGVKIRHNLEIDLSDTEAAICANYKCVFESFGVLFQIVDGKMRITQVPACLYNKTSRDKHKKYSLSNLMDVFVNEQISLLQKTRGVSSKMSPLIQSVINSEACRGAIKFGDALGARECEEMVINLSRCSLPFQCAHGRPTLIPVIDTSKIDDFMIKHSKPHLNKLKL